jgi:hypothetical protein
VVVRHAMLVVARAGFEIVEIPFHEPPFVAAGAGGEASACSGKLARAVSLSVPSELGTGYRGLRYRSHHMVAVTERRKEPG